MKALPEILAEVLGTVERLDIPYVVGGSFAFAKIGNRRAAKTPVTAITTRSSTSVNPI